MQRKLMVMMAASAMLSGCGDSGAALYTLEPGMWRTEVQLLTPIGNMMSPAERAAMDPAEFATMQAQMSRPQIVEAGECRVATPVRLQGLLASARLARAPSSGCDSTSHEMRADGFRLAMSCQANDGPVSVVLDGQVSPGRVATDMQWQAAPQQGQPNPPAMRIRITETRTGDCA
jgi:hypothetical protein